MIQKKYCVRCMYLYLYTILIVHNKILHFSELWSIVSQNVPNIINNKYPCIFIILCQQCFIHSDPWPSVSSLIELHCVPQLCHFSTLHFEFSFFCLIFVSINIILACSLWVLFPAFSSVAISAANHADSRGSLASLDSNPSTNEKNSEATETCEKVRMRVNGWKQFSESEGLQVTTKILCISLLTDCEAIIPDWVSSSV